MRLLVARTQNLLFPILIFQRILSFYPVLFAEIVSNRALLNRIRCSTFQKWHMWQCKVFHGIGKTLSYKSDKKIQSKNVVVLGVKGWERFLQTTSVMNGMEVMEPCEMKLFSGELFDLPKNVYRSCWVNCPPLVIVFTLPFFFFHISNVVKWFQREKKGNGGKL